MYSLPSIVPDAGPLAARDEERLAADRAKARTGLFTPPGISRAGAGESSRERSRDRPSLLAQPFGRASLREVGSMIMSAPGALDAGQDLQHDRAARRSSRCAAAALTIAYSPLTL